jgi:hypothetical protein
MLHLPLVKKKTPFVLMLASIAAVLLVASLYFSTWLYWNMLPGDKTEAFAIAYIQPHAGLLASSPYVQTLLADKSLQNLNRLNYLAYSRGARGETIVVVPRLLSYASVEQELLHEGWHVQRNAFVIEGQRSLARDATMDFNSLPSLFVALRHTLAQNMLHPTHAFPLAIGSMSIQDASYNIVLYNHRQDVAGSLIRGSSDRASVAVLPSIPFSEASTPADLEVSIYSGLLDTIDTPFFHQWEEKMWQSLHLEKTRPNLTGLLGDQASLYVATRGADTVLRVTDTSSAAALSIMSGWINKEDAYFRPQKRVFKLPDGSIGYEVIPGNIKDIMSVPDADNCRKGVLKEVSLWVCLKGDSAAISTTKDLALSSLQEARKPLFVQLNARRSGFLGVAHVDKFVLEGSQNTWSFRMHFKQ